jgi:hypothetical protein
MPLSTLPKPTIYLAGDIGSSGSKFFYRVQPTKTTPLWMAAEVVDDLSLASLPMTGGERPQDNAWLQIDDQVVLVGDAARALLEHNSMKANKSGNAAYKILAALGAIAESEGLPTDYEAVVWLALPLMELKTQAEISQQLQHICEPGFIFRGQFQRVTLTLKCFPEGLGLYLNRKRQLQNMGKTIEHRRTLVMMMGHRNLSILGIEGGSLRKEFSNSNGPGLWPIFEKTALALGVTAVDYRPLMNAVVTDKNRQISQARGRLFDFGEMAEAVRQAYWKAVNAYLQDHLLKGIEHSVVDVIVSGGTAFVFQSQVTKYLESLDIQTLVFADGASLQLLDVVSQLPEAVMNPSLPSRMTDCYGLFQGLLGKVSKVAA